MFTIATRSLNDILTKKAQGLLAPISSRNVSIKCDDIFRTDDFYAHRYVSELFFLIELFNLNGWVICVDDDAYCWDLEEVIKIKNYMEENDYQLCGCLDYNVKINGEAFALNPYFLMADMDKINDIGFKKLPDDSHIEKIIGSDKFSDQIDSTFSFFWYLINTGIKILYFNQFPYKRSKSTLVHGLNKKFLIHAQEARKYNISDEVKKRIDFSYEYAKERYVPYTINANKRM